MTRAAGAAPVYLAVVVSALSVATVSDRHAGTADSSIDRHAVEYLKIVAGLGSHNPESVDFQIDGTRSARHRPSRTLTDLGGHARSLAAHVREAHSGPGDWPERAESLAAQLEAVASRIDQLSGVPLSFEAELQQLFGLDSREIVAGATKVPPYIVGLKPDATSDVRAKLARRLPEGSSLSRRLSDYQHRFVVPRGRLHAVVTRSITECRNQTRRFLTLPEGEDLAVEYVAERPWSGYSLYQGGYKSVMQVNRELPLTVGQVLSLACHEGYPGHHVYNSLREQHVVRARGWSEATALPLFSPEGFQAEAMAAAAAAIVFTPVERLQLLRDELFPLVGLDSTEAERYAEICDLVDRLSSATTLVVEKYLAGELSTGEAAQALRHDALMEHPEGLLAYVDRYRGYALAYTFGRDRILSFLTERSRSVEGRWELLNRFMTSPN
jgi:hypothetical protein